jgi:hypothetical protein
VTTAAKVHVVSTTEQLRVGYYNDDYFSTTVSSTGGVTFNAVGSGSAFTFSDTVTCSSNLAVTGITTLDGQAIAEGHITAKTCSLYFDTYGAHNGMRHRRANGTFAAPTKVISGDLLGFWHAVGYYETGGGAGAFHDNLSAGILYYAAENFTSAACGGNIRFQTTPIGSTSPAVRMIIGAAGNIGIGSFSTEPTAILDIVGSSIRLRTARTPASAAAAGNQGEICWDANYVYVCTQNNFWKRAAIATW